MPRDTVTAVGKTAIPTGRISRTIAATGVVVRGLRRRNIDGFRVSVIVSFKERTDITETTVI